MKKKTSVTLSEQTTRLLTKLVEKTGFSRSQVVDAAVWDFAVKLAAVGPDGGTEQKGPEAP